MLETSTSRRLSDMPDPKIADSSDGSESKESFADILSRFEQNRPQKPAAGTREGRVVSVTADSVLLDIGFKTEGILPLSEFPNDRVRAKPGDTLQVTIKGRDPEGYYQLTQGSAARPKDWAALEKAFADKTTIVGTVTGVVKGGLSVDVGVRAFLPASRSGARDMVEMEKLIEKEIRCRIIKLDAAEEDIVVDRRVVAEEEEQAAKLRLYSALKEGDRVNGKVRSLTDYGAFVDIGGVDALLHVADIGWDRIHKPMDVLSVGQQIVAKVLKIDGEKRRISIGTKQLEPDPWDRVPAKYKVGDRVRGTVTRVMDFGAFVAVESGVEGLIHVSEMSWVKRVRKPSELVTAGETVEVVVLDLHAGERRMSLGLKQALGDPWVDAVEKFRVGSVVEGLVVSLTNFGAFVQVAEGIEGMVHISDISREKPIRHPQEVLKIGQSLRTQVLDIDQDKRRLKLGMKQLAATSIDEYVAEHQEGDIVSGRVAKVSQAMARVELGDGIQTDCAILPGKTRLEDAAGRGGGKGADLASLTSMLEARWKGAGVVRSPPSHEIRAGQVLRFRITKLDRAAKKIEIELESS
ncbi:MAG TPA: S1 RNA-binding domain-containing protein [Terriglobales bacterium]|nr:S1 RNA-binding domain-containing protein [Terriglobales bacterium]